MPVKVLYRCSGCSLPVVLDEGRTFRVSLGHWRINKETGRVTANCPSCTKIHELEPGNEGASSFMLSGFFGRCERTVVAR